MAARHYHSKLIAPGSVILGLVLLLHSGLVAQNSGGKTKPPQQPPAKEAKGPGAKDAGSVRSKIPKGKGLSLRIAVVDMDRATGAHPLFEKRSLAHTEWGRQQSAELDKLDKTIRSKRTQLKNTVQPGSAAAAELRLEIDTLGYKLNRWTKQLHELGAARRARLVLELQAQVLEAIRELAPKRGIDLVLRRRAHLVRASWLEQLKRSESTDVLYASHTLDITEDVIDFLKTKYSRK